MEVTGQQLFENYRYILRKVAADYGRPLAEWQTLPPVIQAAWDNLAQWVNRRTLDAIAESSGLDDVLLFG